MALEFLFGAPVEVTSSAATSAFNQASEYEHRMRQKALELAKGFPPEFNLMPLLELVKKADALGLDLVRRG